MGRDFETVSNYPPAPKKKVISGFKSFDTANMKIIVLVHPKLIKYLQQFRAAGNT